MDRRYRLYYIVKPNYCYKEYVIANIKGNCRHSKCHNQEVSYSFILSVPKWCEESIVFELNKMVRMGSVHNFYEIKQREDIIMRTIYGGRKVVK